MSNKADIAIFKHLIYPAGHDRQGECVEVDIPAKQCLPGNIPHMTSLFIRSRAGQFGAVLKSKTV